MLSGLKHEIFELPVKPSNGSNGLNTGAKVTNLSHEFSPQSKKETVPGVRVRDSLKIKELDDFIASALAQFPVDEFIRRFAVAKEKLQRFYTYKTQLDADQGKSLNFQDDSNTLRLNTNLESPQVRRSTTTSKL